MSISSVWALNDIEGSKNLVESRTFGGETVDLGATYGFLTNDDIANRFTVLTILQVSPLFQLVPQKIWLNEIFQTIHKPKFMSFMSNWSSIITNFLISESYISSDSKRSKNKMLLRNNPSMEQSTIEFFFHSVDVI